MADKHNNENKSENEEQFTVEEMENPFVNKEEEIIDEKLEENIQSEIDTLKNQYVRLAADFDNYRKRNTQEKEACIKYAAEDTLKKLLPVLDTFERAQKSMTETDDAEKIKESFNVVYKQFADALEKAGLQKIEAKDKEFNPMFHEAVMQTPSNEVPDQTVITELQSGYTLNDRVIRPALVNVAVNQ